MSSVFLQAIYRFGGFEVDGNSHTLLYQGTRIPLQEQPLQILLALVEQPGKVVSRDVLRLRLWGTGTYVDFDQSLNSAVRRLRLALQDDSRHPIYVETVPRIGFRFLPAVGRDIATAQPAGVRSTLCMPQSLLLQEAVPKVAPSRFPTRPVGAL